MSRWRVEHAELALCTPHFDVVRSRVLRPDESEAHYHTIDFRLPAVAILLRDDADRILLIRQQRFIVERDVWALPSGGVEEGESLEAAAARELVEETGHSAEAIRHLITYYASYGVSNQVFHCYLAEGARLQSRHDSNEVSSVHWFTRDEVMRLIAQGEIPDGLSLVPLLYAVAAGTPQEASQALRCRRVSFIAK